MPYASRTQHLKPEGAYQVLARASQLEAAGREIVHLEIGQPDYATLKTSAGPASRRSVPVIPATLPRPGFPPCARPSPKIAGGGAVFTWTRTRW